MKSLEKDLLALEISEAEDNKNKRYSTLQKISNSIYNLKKQIADEERNYDFSLTSYNYNEKKVNELKQKYAQLLTEMEK
jgi:cob(I)alamin adenosyltransferase